jgi:hypothetical protein
MMRTLLLSGFILLLSWTSVSAQVSIEWDIPRESRSCQERWELV